MYPLPLGKGYFSFNYYTIWKKIGQYKINRRHPNSFGVAAVLLFLSDSVNCLGEKDSKGGDDGKANEGEQEIDCNKKRTLHQHQLKEWF